jgi:hypothetical protein
MYCHANSLPRRQRILEAWNILLITAHYINENEKRKEIERLVWPPYMEVPPNIEGRPKIQPSNEISLVGLMICS